MFSTIVPDGVGPGQEIHVVVPEGLPSAGMTVLVTVPPGSGPGQEIRVGDPKAMAGALLAHDMMNIYIQHAFHAEPNSVIKHQQINIDYPGLERLPTQPPIYVVKDFLTEQECKKIIEAGGSWMHRAPVVGKGIGVASDARTSTTCFLDRQKMIDIMTKVSELTNKPVEHMEYPQVGRYEQTQKYNLHFDAFETHTEVGQGHLRNGGQRICTCLIYLNTPKSGGCTYFKDYDIRVQPEMGKAVVFFPGTLDGQLESRMMHAAEPAGDEKWVSQIWIRQAACNGVSTEQLHASNQAHTLPS